MKELTKRVDKDGVVSFITTKDPAGHATYVRTAQMMLVKAARDILGSANKQVRIKIEFSLDNACYCSVLGGIRVNTELARKIEERMMEIAEKNIPIIKKNYPLMTRSSFLNARI
jgi:uridine kinase